MAETIELPAGTEVTLTTPEAEALPPEDKAPTPEEAAIAIAAISADRDVAIAEIHADAHVRAEEAEAASRVEAAEHIENAELNEWRTRALVAEAALQDASAGSILTEAETEAEPEPIPEASSGEQAEALAKTVTEQATEAAEVMNSTPQFTSEEKSEIVTAVSAESEGGSQAEAIVAEAPVKRRLFIR